MGCHNVMKAVYREYRARGFSEKQAKRVAGAVAGKIERSKKK